MGHNIEDLTLYDNEIWNDPRDFAKPVTAITLPQDVLSTSDHRLIKLKNQVQHLMEAHLALMQPTQVNKVTTSCEIGSGPHDTQYCMEDPEQAFVEYASLRTDEAGGTLPSDTVKNSKLSTSPVLSARSYPTEDPQCSTHVHGSINIVTIHPKQQSDSYDDITEENEEEEKDNPENIYVNPSIPPDLSVSFITEKVLKLNSFFESLGLVTQSSNTKLVCTKGDDGDVMFIEIVQKNDDSCKKGPKAREQEVEYFDMLPTRSELAYHKYLMCGPIPSIFLRNPIITEGCPSNLKIPCNIRHVHVEKAYIDLKSPINIMTRMINFTYFIDFMIVEYISSIIDPRMSQVVLGGPFVEISNTTYDPPEGVVRFTNGTKEVAYKMPKEHIKLVYLRNKEDKRRGVEYVMPKILGFYKECLKLEPECATGMDDEG
ncbi:hypothetical protein Tco_1116906 [Tanacetum coccineum]